MKKTLAIVLSIALTLSLCAGLFVFPASAETPAKDYATTKAEELWAATQSKAEVVRISLYDEGKDTVTFILANNTSVNLAEKGAFTGTVSLKDGVLTLDKVSYNTETADCYIEPAGAVKVNITGGDFYGTFRNDSILTEKVQDPSKPDDPEAKVDGPYVSDTTDNHILLTSDGHKFVGTGSGNNISANGAIVIYGNIALDMQCVGGYHNVICRASGAGRDIIIAPEKDSLLSVDAHGPVIENRSGSVIFGGKATITLKNPNAGAATNGKQIVNVTSAAAANSSVQFIEDVNVIIENKSVGAVFVDAAHSDGKDAIVFDTTGTVKYTSTDTAVTSWASAFMANKGSISVKKGTVLANVNIASYTGGSYHLFGMDNSGGAGDATDFKAKISVTGDAEVAARITSNATASTRMGAIWVNSATIEFTDNAKFTAVMNYAGATNHSSTSTIVAKVGTVIVDKNAKVLLYRDAASQGYGPNGIDVQDGNKTEAQKAAFNGIQGLFMKGGQLEINGYNYAIGVASANSNPNPYNHSMTFTGGVLAMNGKKQANGGFNCFGKNPSAPDAPYYNTLSGYVFAGRPGDAVPGKANERWSQYWLYMGEDDAYTYFNGVADHADFFGASTYMVGALSATANAIAIPADGNYEVSGTGVVKLGEKVVPNGAVVTLKYGDVLTGEGISIAMTKASATAAAAPANLKVVDGSVTASGAKVTWDAADYAVSYNVYANGTLVGSTDKTELQMTLMSNTEYAITVKGVNFGGEEGAASAAANLTTEKGASDFTKPAAPANVKVSSIDSVSATITWDAVADASSYDVYVNGEKVNASPVTGTSFDVTGLTAATDYKVQVTATNLAGSSDKTAEVSFKSGLEGVANSVTIVLADGTSVVLDKQNPTATVGSGTATYDRATGVLTIENITGAQAIQALTSENLTIRVKGTNTLENTSQTNALRALQLTLEGDGTLNLKSTHANAYVVLGQQGLTFQGDVKFNLDVVGGNAAIHAARTTGDNFIIIKDNAQVSVKNDTNRAMYIAGERSRMIITDNAVVNIETVKSDGICVLSDSDREWDGDALSYLEISGKAKVTIKAGSCGIRMGLQLKGTADAHYTKNNHSEVIIKDSAAVDITAPGQVIYLSFSKDATNDGTFTANYSQTGNAQVKLTNTGNYAGLEVKSGNGNTVTISGGTFESYAPNKSAISVSGKTSYDTGKGTIVAGDDAASATAAEKITTSAKYLKVTNTNPGTSDVSVVAAASVAVIAALAGLAVVSLRKKSEN